MDPHQSGILESLRPAVQRPRRKAPVRAARRRRTAGHYPRRPDGATARVLDRHTEPAPGCGPLGCRHVCRVVDHRPPLRRPPGRTGRCLTRCLTRRRTRRRTTPGRGPGARPLPASDLRLVHPGHHRLLLRRPDLLRAGRSAVPRVRRDGQLHRRLLRPGRGRDPARADPRHGQPDRPVRRRRRPPRRADSRRRSRRSPRSASGVARGCFSLV